MPKIVSKNGIKLKITPKNWWNFNHWIWVFDHMEICSGQDWHMNNKETFTYGTIERI